MFWRKCGKLISDGASIIRCDYSPCPYYAVLGFKYRWLNQETMEPTDKCTWSFEVGVYTVQQGKIDWMETCIPISTNSGEVAHKKFKSGCWTDCFEWDDQGNCINEVEHCMNAYEVYVYNISGCYDNYEDFLDAFYGECGIQRNEEGKYDEDPLEGGSSSCMETWLKKFKDEYALTYSIKMKSQIQTWYINGLDQDWTYTKYCGCPDSYYEASGDCPSDCEDVWEPSRVNSCGASAIRTDTPINSPPFSQYFKYIKGGGKFDPWYTQDCCDENGARSKIGAAFDYAYSYIDNPNVYRNNGTSTKQCTHSNNLCFEVSYNSRGNDNPYGDRNSIYYDFKWYTLLLERLEDTPEGAIGVRFNAHITRTLANTGAGEGDENLDDQQTVTEEETDFTLYFDEEFKDLPFSTNLTKPSFIELPVCDSNCEWIDGETKIQPYPTGWWAGSQYKHDNWTEYIDIKFIGVEYVKNK